MLNYFNSTKTDPTIKPDKTIVTKADIQINKHVIDILAKETPSYSVWGEEQSSIKKDAEYTWVCDPIDGTMPFAKGLPISTFSLALVNNQGRSVVGVIYDPFQDRLYEAVYGLGAFLNGKKIQVSNTSSLDGALIDNEIWKNSYEGVNFDEPKTKFVEAGVMVTSICSACIAGCLVAQGNYDAMIFGQGKPEDIAALAIIIPEAGGTVTNLFGKQQRYDTNINGAIVSNGKIHNEIKAITSNMNYRSKYII